MKRIVVISGVTGAIGSSLFSEYAQSSDTVIYGISRKALAIDRFLVDGKLPQKTLICSINIPNGYENLANAINYTGIDEVIYIHAMGLYPFEVNNEGKIVVENDSDNDGINDDATKLTYDSFAAAVTGLTQNWKGKIKCIIFGGIADKHEPAVHQSWWKTMKKVKAWATEIVSKNTTLSILIFNISSVICPHEVITRPYVFIHTDADQTKWLHPHELAQFVTENERLAKPGLHEIEKYRVKEHFDPATYYKDSEFTPRKVDELY